MGYQNTLGSLQQENGCLLSLSCGFQIPQGLEWSRAHPSGGSSWAFAASILPGVLLGSIPWETG